MSDGPERCECGSAAVGKAVVVKDGAEGRQEEGGRGCG